jgi:uncharacterized protein
MTDRSAPTYRHLLEKAQEIGRADGRFAAAFEPPGSDADRGPRSFGRTPAQLARLLWEDRPGTPPAGLEVNAPLWYAAGFTEGLTVGAVVEAGRPRRMTPEQIITVLGLERGTCGYMELTYRSQLDVAPDTAAPRTIGQALYFLITPTARVALHRIRSDQIYHHYAGDALDVLLLPDERPGQVRVVGPALDEGMRPQLLIPAGTFHVARLHDGGEWALLGTTSWPGVAEGEFEKGDVDALQRRHGALAQQIAEFVAA